MKKIITLFALLLAVCSYAQPGSLDTSFNPADTGFGNGDGANGNVRATSLQLDGKIIIVGEFKDYNKVVRNGIARLNADGSLDMSFNPGTGIDNYLNSVLIQPDGKIIIGGNFSKYNGASRNDVARLNADGSLDASFNFTSGSGTSNGVYIYMVALQPDAKILIGGFDENNMSYVDRLNADGSADIGFNRRYGVYASVQPNGKIIFGSNTIVRLNSDGSLDSSFKSGIASNLSVSTTVIQQDGKIIVGGNFSYKGGSVSNIARLNEDGSLDNGFNPGIGANGTVEYASLQSDGKIVIRGRFTSYNGIAVNSLARLNTDGSLDASFNSGPGSVGIEQVDCITNGNILIQQDDKIIFQGLFGTFNGIKTGGFIRLNADGSLDKSFNSGTGVNSVGSSGGIQSIALQADGKIIISGSFVKYNGTFRNNIARLNLDGSLDPSFGSELSMKGNVYSTIIQQDGKIIIGGDFTAYKGTAVRGVARLNVDGSLDTSFNSGTGFNGTVYTISLQSDGKIIIGGLFTTYNGTPRKSIARLNPDGTLDITFNPKGDNSNIYILSSSIQSDGKIIIGGYFPKLYGTNVNSIARLNTDGSLDTSFQSQINPEGSVSTTALQLDGKIIIGGNFITYNGIKRKSIARLNCDGSLDASFDPGEGLGSSSEQVSSMLIQSDGKIIIIGPFATYNNINRKFIARLNSDGSLDDDLNVGLGADDYVKSTLLQPDGKIILGGSFTSYNGVGRNRIVRINGDAPSLGIENGYTPSLSINNIVFAKSIQLYPNPVSDILTIDSQEDIAPEVEIFDVLGKSVKILILFDKKVDVSSLPSGVYIINMTNGNNGVYRSKFVKK